MDNKETYWVVIYPYVFIFNKGGKTLFYNSETGESIFSETNREILELSKPENMYSLLVDENVLTKSHVFRQIIEKHFGELIPFEKCNKKPVSIYPQCLIERQEEEELIFELKELTIMLTGECSLKCIGCDYIYKQCLWCHKKADVIPFNRIKSFLGFIPLSGVSQINIIGGDILTYVSIDEFLLYVTEFKVKIRIFLHYELVNKHLEKLLKLFGNYDFSLVLLINSPFIYEVLLEITRKFEKFKVNYKVLVSSEKDYENAIKLSSNDNLDIIPIYNGKNLSFFVDNVFLNKEDIINSHVSMKEIFAHKLINTNTFGKLVVYPDGQIFANVNKSPIGTIDDNIYKIIQSQLIEGSDWRSIRINKECLNCLFQWLCPSPSDYGIVLNVKNMCHLSP